MSHRRGTLGTFCPKVTSYITAGHYSHQDTDSVVWWTCLGLSLCHGHLYIQQHNPGMELLCQPKDLLHATHPCPWHSPLCFTFWIYWHFVTWGNSYSCDRWCCLVSFGIIRLESIHVLCYPNFMTFYHWFGLPSLEMPQFVHLLPFWGIFLFPGFRDYK